MHIVSLSEDLILNFGLKNKSIILEPVITTGERVRSNLTRFVVIVWVFVVLVLTSSYTANLTSMLTVEQLQPSITDINDLIRSRDFVGFQDGSFVSSLFSSMNFDRSMFTYYSSFEEYDEALSKGSRNGGVGAIVDELPYIRLFLSKYCSKYTMIGPIYQTSGFGFLFPKGSPLTPDVSRAILKLKEDEAMLRISRKWFGNGEGCNSSDGTLVTSKSLNLDSFKGLFLIAGLSSLFSLAIFLSIFLYENRHIWRSSASLKQKLCELATVFCQEKEKVDTLSSTRSRTAADSPAISIYCDQEGMFSQDEGFSTMESKSIQHE